MQVCHQSFVFDVFWAHVDQDHSIERPFGVTEDGETRELSTEGKKQWMGELRLHKQIVVQKKRVAVEMLRKIRKSGKEMLRKVWEEGKKEADIDAKMASLVGASHSSYLLG